MTNTINVIRVGVADMDIEGVKIPNELESFQKLVDGYIEIAPMPELEAEGLLLIVNEEGLFKHEVEVNLNLIPYFIAGQAIIVANGDNEDFESLSPYQLLFVTDWLDRMRMERTSRGGDPRRFR